MAVDGRNRSPLSATDYVPSAERKSLQELAFTVESLGEQWESCLRNWQNALGSFGPTLDHYFSLNRSEGMPVEHRFLSLVQALESFHRRRFPEMLREPVADFRARKRRLLAAAPKEERKWLANALQWANELSLRQRVAHLWEMMPESVRQRLGSQHDFSKRVADTRNYLTHFNEQRKGAAVMGRDTYDLVVRLSTVLRVVFLLQLGLDAETVLQRPWGNRLLARIS